MGNTLKKMQARLAERQARHDKSVQSRRGDSGKGYKRPGSMKKGGGK